MRSHDTYRAVRRTYWSAARTVSDMPWRDFNVQFYGNAGFSIPERVYPPTLVRSRSRSKYMPHIGKKERGRYLPAA